MDESLNTVNAVQGDVVDTQTPVTPESGNVDVATTQEQKQDTKEKPVQTAEENSRFAEVRRKAESAARDNLIAEMYGESHGIKTYAEYQERLKQQLEQEQIDRLAEENNVSPEIAQQLVKAKEFEARDKRNNDLVQFGEWYKNTLGKDLIPEEIPADVWLKYERGVPLTAAYAEHYLVIQKTIKEAEQVIEQTKQANAKIADRATGEVAGNVEHEVMNEETINAHADDTRWMMKNYDKVTDYYRKKKG